MAKYQPVHRPPYELGSALLPVTEGCNYHACRFCSIYSTEFSVIDDDTINRELETFAQPDVGPRRVYLAHGNPFALDQDRLISILTRIRETLPLVTSVGGFCRIIDVKRRSDEELAEWAALGVDDITIGAESGLDDALRFMNKGHTSTDILEQCARLHKAGIRFTLFYMAGLAGAGRGLEHAEATAKVFSQAAPHRILLLSLTVFSQARLAEDVASGRFTPASEIEVLEEMRAFIGAYDGDVLIQASNDLNMVKFEGVLPRDREGMIALLTLRIEKSNERLLTRYREAIATHRVSI